LLIGREFFVMGLRIIAAELGLSIHVSYLGKVKTVLQVICLLCAILLSTPSPYYIYEIIKNMFFACAIGVSFFSAYCYCCSFSFHVKKK